MSEPLVSIIIPVYNGGNYLREAIDSALAQTYPNIEIIVVNDGSCDNGVTEEIALSYGEKIRYYVKENGGVATALNVAIQKMKGMYFSWLSHDDMYYPNKIKRQMQALQEHGDLTAIVHSDYDLLNANNQEITHVFQSEMYPMEQMENSVFPVLQGVIHGCSLLIHKSHFERVGIFEESLKTTQDYDLWFRMMRYQRTLYINEPLILIRLHKEQGTHTSSNLDYYKSEQSQLRVGFINALTEEELVSMYGSAYNFYHKMFCFFKGGNMTKAYQFANHKFQSSSIPDDLTEKLLYLKGFIKELTNGQTRKISIFCAGEYGIRLYEELRSKLITVDSFSDNNPGKWGYLFDNITCISPEELEKEKDNTLIIVATRIPTEIVKQLKSAGFPYVTTKQEIDKVLFNVPPVKWVNSLNDIEGIDYSSNDVMLLINKFNQTVFDICNYYEGRSS